MAGRPNKPDALRELEGDKRNTLEPKPPVVIHSKPDWLTPEGVKYWNHYYTELLNLGLITSIDINAFIVFVEACADFEIASKDIQKNGQQIVGARQGGLVRNPAVQIKREAGETIIKIGREFGMTPSSRQRLSTGPVLEQTIEEILAY